MQAAAALFAALCLLAPAVAAAPPEPAAAPGPSGVRIVREEGAYRLLVDGAPFRVRGAGLSGGDLEALAARGGNALRTWSSGPDRAATTAMLDRAHRLGLRVAMGLEAGKQRHGFDYGDAAAVAAQRERVLAEVAAYKDHPAVLVWLIGNELNLESTDPDVWDAVGDLAEAIRALDPDHPVGTPLAGVDREALALLQARAPALDFVGLQVYGGIADLQAQLRDSGWRKPYLVTEWGPTGHWESPETAWGAPIEDDATRKAELLLERHRRDIDSDRRQGLGDFVFLWGQKQERTPTWYGLFLASGESTPGVDAMQRLWTGRWPDNRAPSIAPIRLDGRAARDSVTLAPGAAVRAQARAGDPDGDPLAWRWTLREESAATSIGGDPEALPPEVPAALSPEADGSVRFDAPARDGAYRLFLEVRDGRGHAAYANFPFRVAGDGDGDGEGEGGPAGL